MIPLDNTKFLEYAHELIHTRNVTCVRDELERLLLLGDCLGNYGSFYNVYGFMKQGYVIKVIKDDNLPLTYYHNCPLKDSLASKFFLYPITKTRREEVILQPLADISTRKQEFAFRTILYKLREKLKEGQLIEDVWPDAHVGNVGVYHKKPYIIDFSHKYLE